MPPGTTIIVGNLDGVHSGHRQLLATARQAVGEQGRLVVLSFDPHPMTVLRPDHAPTRLTTFRERERLLREQGADDVIPLRPDADLLAQTPEQFVEQLVRQYAPSTFVEGPDFRFGKGRTGDVETLRQLGEKHGYETIVIDPVTVTLSDRSIVRASSTVLRWLIDHGRVNDAAAVLGRPYELVATVVRGDQRGRDIGFPTANLDHEDCLLPADGIYAGVGRRGDQSWPAAISVGRKPTFGSHPRICEAHFVGYDGPLDDYGWTLRLTFTAWLRDQVGYPDIDSLMQQIQRDVDRTSELASTVSTAGPA